MVFQAFCPANKVPAMPAAGGAQEGGDRPARRHARGRGGRDVQRALAGRALVPVLDGVDRAEAEGRGGQHRPAVAPDLVHDRRHLAHPGHLADQVGDLGAELLLQPGQPFRVGGGDVRVAAEVPHHGGRLGLRRGLLRAYVLVGRGLRGYHERSLGIEGRRAHIPYMAPPTPDLLLFTEI
jgi:hypothetical protein